MSYAPSFRAPGGHIFDVVAPGLKKHVFTAMLAQHVASELPMRLWTSRSRTDRNTPNPADSATMWDNLDIMDF